MIRWAVAGTGAIARRFAADMRFATKGRVAAIASRDPARARDLARVAGEAVAYGELAEILARADIDAVYVAGLNETHADVAIEALAAGKPVLMEKPFAVTRREAERVIEAARTANLLVMEAMWMRFTPGIVQLKALLDEGVIGRPVRLEASLSFRNERASADPLLDLGVYPISLALHLLGPASAGTALRMQGGASLLLDHDEATLVASVGFTDEGVNRAFLVGERGILSTDAPFFCPSHVSLRRIAEGASRTAARPGDPLPAPRRFAALRQALKPLRDRRILTSFAGSGLQYQADHFAGLLATGATDSPVMPLADTLQTLDWVETLSASAAKLERGR